MSGTFTITDTSRSEETLISRLNLSTHHSNRSIPVSYPSIIHPSVIHSSISESVDHPQNSPHSKNSRYTNPSQASGTTIHPPEHTERGVSFNSAPPSSNIFSANQPERSYLQPPPGNNPHTQTSPNRYPQPPQSLLHSTRLHLGELGYGNLDRRSTFDIF